MTKRSTELAATEFDVTKRTPEAPPSHDSPVFAETELDASRPSGRHSAEPSSKGRFAGSKLDHFRVDKLLGQGGMGAVYLGHDESLDRPVALKVLKDELAGSKEALSRFVREAQAQARVSSPHIVQIFFVGHVPPPNHRSTGALYFAMELVEGESLETILERNEKIDPEKVRTIMLDAAKGLADARRAGIIHRDIKPGNLLLTRTGLTKVADFGLAKSGPNVGMTAAGVVLGTPHYMPPEQGLGEVVDYRADMYSLGCTFYNLLVGDVPFHGQTPVAIIAQHLDKAPPSILSRNPTVPRELCAIVERLMQKKKESRYGSYDELILALEAADPKKIEYAGFWTRAAAAGLDLITAGLLIGVIPWKWLGLSLFITYVTIGHAVWGQTLGKYVIRIQVLNAEQRRLGFARALLRTVATYWVPCLIGIQMLWTSGIEEVQDSIAKLGGYERAKDLIDRLALSSGIANAVLTLLYAAGFLMAAFRRDKRAAQDIVSGSFVRYKLRK